MFSWRSARGRAFLTGLLFVLLLAAVGVVAVWRARDMQERHESLEHTSLVAASLERAHARFFEGVALLAVPASAQETPSSDLYLQAASDVKQQLSLAHAEALADNEGDLAVSLDSLIGRISRFEEGIVPAAAAVSQASTEEALEAAVARLPELMPEAYAIGHELDRLAQQEQGTLAAERAAADRAAATSLLLLLGLSVFVLLGGAVTLSSLVASVIRPLSSLQTRLRTIASGDLKVRATESGLEEVASLARDFNEMVAERGQVEEALRASRERYQELFENANDIVFTLGLDGLFTSLNKAGEDVLGYTRGRAERMNMAEIMPADSLARAQEMIRRKVARGGPTRYEAEIIASDGRLVPLEISTRLIYKDGEPFSIQGIARDISERKRMEQALRESEAKFRELADTTAAAIFIYQGTKVRYVNAAAETLTGFTREELVGADFWQVIHPDSRDMARDRGVARQRGADVPPRYELKLLTKSGEERWVDYSAASIEFEGETAVIGTTYDVTERKRAEEALRESEERYRGLFESASDLIQGVAPDGSIVYVNRAWREALGYSEDEIPGLSLPDIIHPESREHCMDVFRRVLAGETVVGLEAKFISKGGKDIIVEGSTSCSFKDGTPTAIRGIFRDVSERRQAEDALRESEERYRGLFESASDLIQSVAPDGSFVYVNRAWREALGYSEEEIPGLTLLDMIHPDSREFCAETFRRVLAGENVVGVEAKFVGKDGRTIIVEGSAGCSFKDGKPVATRGIFRDITERKRAEEALREQARRDPLTGALNHAAIVEELQDLLSDRRDGPTHAVAMVDVDGLKAINDTFGHQTGDAVLVEVARALSRDGAIVGRYGGDEFVALLPGSDRPAALRYRDAVLATLAGADLSDPETSASVPIAVSIGLVVYPTEAGRIEDLIKLADSEMYAAKRQRPIGSADEDLPQPLSNERAAKMVSEIMPLLTSPGDVDEKLRLAAHRLSIGACCEAVSFSMFSPDSGGATVSQSFGRLPAGLVEAWDQDVRSEWELPHPLRLLLERTRRPVVLEDIENDDRIPARQRELLRAAGLRSGLVIPLLLEDTAVGLLAVGSKREAAFGPNEAQFFMAIATQVAGIARMATLVEELQAASDRLAEARTETVMLLAASAEAHDHTTGLHLQNVRAITEALARQLGYGEEDARELGLAAVLHDIGKVRVPDSVLGSTGRLSDEEWELMKHHSTWGEQFLRKRRGFELAATIARSHHEHWDGSGYPEGLSGDDIPEAATIVAVADAFDAMISDRPYRAARSVTAALREITACSGTQFSPKVVRAITRLRRRKLLPTTIAESRDRKAAA